MTIFALPYTDTRFPPEREWTEADRVIAEGPLGHRRRQLPHMPMAMTMDQLRSMPDLELNAALAELKDSVVATSLDGFRISVAPFQWHLMKRAMWDARHPALRPRRSKRRRRRELARAPRNTRALS